MQPCWVLTVSADVEVRFLKKKKKKKSWGTPLNSCSRAWELSICIPASDTAEHTLPLKCAVSAKVNIVAQFSLPLLARNSLLP